MFENLKNIFKKKRKSCNFLEYGGIHFVDVDKYRPCCPNGDYSWELIQKIQKNLEAKDKFNAENYKKHIKNLIKSNQKNNAPCKNCIYFKEKIWEKIKTKYLINHRLILSYHTMCNLRCNYCTIDDSLYTKNPENIAPVLRNIIEQKLLNPKCIIEFSGGEPAILQYLSEILELFKSNGNRIIFYSNCTIFSQEI